MPQPKNYDQWKEWCDIVQTQTSIQKIETKKQRHDRIEKLRDDYSLFVSYYFPHYCLNSQTGAEILSAPFHIKAANKILKEKNIKAVFEWARGHAKSTHMDVFIPLWLKCQKNREINVMVLIGKSQDNANTLLADIQAELQFNQRYIADFGEQYSQGIWMEGKFVTKDECAFFARGRGQSPRGLRYRNCRPDYIVIDDLDDDELCENDKRVHKLTDWVKEALFGTLDGGRGRFIMVGNLISKNSVLYNLSQTQGVYFSQVNTYDKQGNVSWSEKWTKQEVQNMEQFMGYRSFQKEMMNNPITEGAVFHNEWIHYIKPLPLKQYDQIIAYCDPSFKGSSKNDYKAIKVWAKKGTYLHCLNAFVRQCSIGEMVRWFYDLHEYFQNQNVICNYYIEANFLQDIILDEFQVEGNIRGYQLPIKPDKRKKPDKFQRIEAISPLWERGFVFYNIDKKNDNDMLTALEQTLSFEKGMNSHDDAPDADEGAIYLLQKSSRLENFNVRLGYRKTKTLW
jgi:predicted phage terminase large subunit-like protein